jgi:hypothetical protein
MAAGAKAWTDAHLVVGRRLAVPLSWSRDRDMDDPLDARPGALLGAIAAMDENPYQAPQAMPAGEEPPAEPAERRPPFWFLALHGIAYCVALIVIRENFRLGSFARLATLLITFAVIAAIFAAIARRLFPVSER